MKIFFITTEYITEKVNWDGGLSTYLGKITKYLNKKGHDISVFVLSDEDSHFDFNGIKVYRVKAPSKKIVRYVKKFLNSTTYTAIDWLSNSYCLNKRIKDVVKTNGNPDIIQYSSYTGTGFFRTKNIPSVVRLSSIQYLCDRAYKLNELESKYKSWVERKAILKADSVFGPSIKIANIFEKDTGRAVEIIETPFEKDLEFNDSVFRDAIGDKKYLLFFGTLGQLKGGLLIAEIIYELLEKFKNLHFVICGKDSGYNGRMMIEYIWEKAGNNRGRVLYIGRLEKKHLFPVIKNSELVVLPSKVDNFPNAAIEAMSFGKVVVGTYEGGFDQLIKNGSNGFLINYSSTELLNKIQSFLSLSEEKKDEMEREAQKTVERLDIVIIGQKTIDFYKRVANG